MKGLFFLVVSLISSVAIAQEDSLVTIYAKYAERDTNGRSIMVEGNGTGVVIKKLKDAPGNGYYSYVLTAAHVAGTDIKTMYPDGTMVERAKVVKKDDKNDVAIIETWTPNSVKPVEMAETITEGDEIFIYSPRGVRRTKVSVVREGEIYADAFSVSGESGSPVLNNQKQVVGVISGGSMWLSEKKFKVRKSVKPKDSEEERTATWPTRMGNVFSIKKLLQ